MSVVRLKQMFDQMVIAKDATMVSEFYAPSFVMESNGVTQGYVEFVEGHERLYGTDITYAVTYDDEAWVEADRRVAGRLWITTERPGERPTRFEVVLIATFDRQGRIDRVRETTWPDWSSVGAMAEYE
jgi:hypothetical protein